MTYGYTSLILLRIMANDGTGIKKLTPNTIINNRYTIKNLIARGGMAFTYCAEDKKTGRLVVLKVLSLSGLENWKTFDLFKREISVLKNIHHPQIPDYIDHCEVQINGDEYYILVQEHVDGSNLYDLVKRGEKFSLSEIRQLLKSLLKILSFIHGLHPPIIHRDINPKNIIINKKGIVYLVDFSATGFIRKTTLAAAKSDTFVGTIGYMPPEQIYGKVLPQSDLYSLGVTIIFLLSGREPSEFEVNDLELDYKPYINIPVDLENLLDMMIDPHSTRRPDSAGQALAILDKKYSGKKINKKAPDENRNTGEKVKISEPLLNDLYAAIEENNIHKVKRLITLGARINPHNPGNKPPLKRALELNHLAIARVLIKYGAEVNTEYSNRNLLHDSVLAGSKEQILLLLKYGAEINARDTKLNKTALQYAYENGNYKIYNLLLKCGAKGTYITKNKSRIINLPPPPRHVSFHTRSLIKYNEMDIMGFIFAIKGLIFVFFFIFSARVIPSFYLAGADSTTDGHITRIELADSSENDDPMFKYYYQFTTDDNNIYNQYSFNTGSLYDDGETVIIKYLSTNPHVSVIEGARYSNFGGEVLMVLILPIVGFGLLGYKKPKAYKYIMLLKWGKAAEGKIVYKKRKQKKLQFIYEYTDESMRKRRGKYTTGDPNFADIGQTLPVLYQDIGWFEFSEILDEPISFENNMWDLGIKGSGKKWATFTAILRGMLWLVLSVIILLSIMGVNIG